MNWLLVPAFPSSIRYLKRTWRSTFRDQHPDGKAKLEDLDDWGYQPFLGLTYAFSDRVMLGVVYRAEMDVDLEGDVEIRKACRYRAVM